MKTSQWAPAACADAMPIAAATPSHVEPMRSAADARPQATPLYPGNGYPTGMSATNPRAIGASAQRAPRGGEPKVPDWTAGAALGRSGRPRLSILPPLPESGWYAEEDEDGELRGISPIRRLAAPNSQYGALANVHRPRSIAALDSAISVLSSACQAAREAGGGPDLGSVFLPQDSGRRLSLEVLR